jgi:hypothetical protein
MEAFTRPLERELDSAHLPSIMIHHGKDDKNCPLKDTEKFKESLHQNYQTAYPRVANDERNSLVKVEKFTGHPALPKKTDLGHGYDYWQTDEPFQIECYGRVSRYWSWMLQSRRMQYYIRCTDNGPDGIESTYFHPPCLMNFDWSEIQYVADMTSIMIWAPYRTMKFERCGPDQRAFTAYARLWIAPIIGIYGKVVMMITLQITGMYA